MVDQPEQQATYQIDVASAAQAVQKNLLGAWAVTVTAGALRYMELLSPLATDALLLFIGFPIYYKIAQKLADSLGFDNLLSLDAKGVAAVFITHYAAFASWQVFAGSLNIGIGTFVTLTQAFAVAFAIFAFIAFLYYRLFLSDDFRQLQFHWQFVLVTAVAAAIPVAAVKAVQVAVPFIKQQVMG